MWLFPNDFVEDLLSKEKDFLRSQSVTYNDNISEMVPDRFNNRPLTGSDTCIQPI